ncbi:secreted RxLR effector protein 161-like [Mangifera indica]|uniref:secreted RxLR effector protein 161-like n=1 Tax=Mangifera indica TaxID=29780 RepID=UPI001CF9F069|nr:secreted RxLR effector protein 161-like [Mangifera indica]
MDEEIEAIKKNDTWELTNLPIGVKKVGVKWVYKTKLNENGEVEKLQTHEGRGWIRVDNSRYKQIISNLMYLTATRPDTMFVMSLLSRSIECPTELHLQVAKRVLRYIKETFNFGIFYRKKGDEKLIAYTNSDYVGDLDGRRSNSGYIFLLNSGVVSWLSKKQPIVTLSTTETEFVAAASCAC